MFFSFKKAFGERNVEGKPIRNFLKNFFPKITPHNTSLPRRIFIEHKKKTHPSPLKE